MSYRFSTELELTTRLFYNKKWYYLKGFSVEVKFNEQEAKPAKYNKFIQNYPDFPLEFWW